MEEELKKKKVWDVGRDVGENAVWKTRSQAFWDGRTYSGILCSNWPWAWGLGGAEAQKTTPQAQTKRGSFGLKEQPWGLPTLSRHPHPHSQFLIFFQSKAQS